ncbi:hypothetical protein HK102_010112 [Quaeritorhiza haematococci]|nr:hypothetical protein HK102_010112 [Quaeritorhiza haematococci]
MPEAFDSIESVEEVVEEAEEVQDIDDENDDEDEEKEPAAEEAEECCGVEETDESEGLPQGVVKQEDSALLGQSSVLAMEEGVVVR